MNTSNLHAGGENSDQFQETFQLIMESVFEKIKVTTDVNMTETIEWLKSAVAYNVPYGKQIRGRLVETVYKELVKFPSEENLQLARVLGWCLEILQASLLVADDIIDNWVIRRGHLCWYRVNNQGNIALNDAFLLEHVAIQVINFYFGGSDLYADILKLFLETTFKTLLGQSLDTRIGKERHFDKFSAAAYKAIVTYKTSYYSFYISIAMAMTLAGISPKCPENQQIWKQMEDTALKIGTLYQIQDDYMDYIVDYQTRGKIGNDIEEGKCSWLFVMAKEMCTGEQYKLLKENYGCKEPAKIAAVKTLYSNLGLEGIYTEYKNKMHDALRTDVEKVEHTGLKVILCSLIDNIVKRNY